MTRTLNYTRTTILMALVVMVLASWAQGDVSTITLKSTVRINNNEPITLAHIGTIQGDQAKELGQLIIDPLIKGQDGLWQHLNANDLRNLIEQEPGFHAGSVIIHGNSVHLRRTNHIAVPTTSPSATKESEQAEEQPQGPTVRGHIERWIRDRYQVGDDLLKMTFRDSDESFLSISSEGRLIEIREISKRGRVSVRVVIYDGYEIIDERALIFDVEIFRPLLVARVRINRGTILDESHFMTERRWVLPDEHAANPEQAIGMAISTTINPGQLLKIQHIELPLVIRRGDIVSAKSIAGSVVVTVRGRAKGNARQGEIVEIESMNRQNTFTARAIDKGKALIIRDTPPIGD